jgi:amidase
MSEDPCTWSAARITQAVTAREIKAVEVVEAHLARIDRVNPAITAIVQVRAEEVLAEARAADSSRAAVRRPLEGVPVTVKEHYDVAGMVQSEGSAALAERRSPSDSVVVARLRGAGALVLGKTNQPDFAMRWNTISGLYGATRNPRDRSRSAGGSSGGDAAATAAGLTPLGIGSDLGGSVRVPAAFCGVCGLRTTAGRVPLTSSLEPIDGTPARDQMNSAGPIARSISDLRLALGVLAGAHPADPASQAAPLATPDRRARPRVARMVHAAGALIDPLIEAEVDRAAEALADSGYEVVEAEFPSAREAPDLWGRLLGTELLRFSIPSFRDQMEATCRQHIEALLGLWEPSQRVEDYLAACVHRRRLVRETALWMDEHPLVLAPVAGMPPPPLHFDHLLSPDETRELFDRMRHAVWVPLLGLPAVALPNGVQLVARRFREEDALVAGEEVLRSLAPVTVAEPEPAADCTPLEAVSG